MMLPVYSIFLKVDPGLLGIVMAFPRLMSALAASLAGGCSDNLRSRFGRRRPLILIGGVTTALLLADVCDEDELQTGLRREGAYSSAASVFSKSISVVLMVLSGYMPHLVGYLNAAVPPTGPQLLAMKWLLILAQGVFVTFAIVSFLPYPITRERALETHVELESRHRRKLDGDHPNYGVSEGCMRLILHIGKYSQ